MLKQYNGHEKPTQLDIIVKIRRNVGIHLTCPAVEPGVRDIYVLHCRILFYNICVFPLRHRRRYITVSL